MSNGDESASKSITTIDKILTGGTEDEAARTEMENTPILYSTNNRVCVRQMDEDPSILSITLTHHH
jgi:hypothetical protein